MLVQSKDEIIRIFDEWGRQYAPSNLIQSEKNATLLADYVLKTYGIVSITYLSEAMNALAPQLDWIPQPKPKTQEELAREFEAREFQRIQKEKADNEKGFEHNQKMAVEARKAQEARRQEAAQNSIEELIGNYSVNAGPGRIDHAKSEAGRKTLRGIKVKGKDGKYDSALTLKVLQSAHLHDTPQQIIRAAERAVTELNNANDPQKERERAQAEERKTGGAPPRPWY